MSDLILIDSATGNQVLYFVGLAYSTPTIGCALTNILPAVTFLLAVIFRQESVGVKKRSDQAKLTGTIVCVGGAMLLSFYNGPRIGIPDSSIHWGYAQRMSQQSAANNNSHLIFGSFIVILSAVAYSLWVIIQVSLNSLIFYFLKIFIIMTLSHYAGTPGQQVLRTVHHNAFDVSDEYNRVLNHRGGYQP